MKVSVIIPVYNAEKTLKNSLQSLAIQTCRDFEVVFFDDCSTDGSLAIIEEFSQNLGLECKIIRQPQNVGVAAARNRALDVVTGDYVMWLDADDTVTSDAIEKAIAIAVSTNADIVGWDWTLSFSKNGRYMRQADYFNPVQAVKNMMSGTMRWNLWLFMYKRCLIENHNLRFIDGANMGEDMLFTISAFLHSKNVYQIHESLYCYNAVSTSSISRQFCDERRIEVTKNLNRIEHAVKISDISDELSPYINYLKLFIKLPLLMSADKAYYKIWYNWMPESNRFAFSNKEQSIRTRFVQWFASKQLWSVVRMYYCLVYKVVYGFIYR